MKASWSHKLLLVLFLALCPAGEAADLVPAQRVRELVKELKSDYWPDRARAASALGDLGPDAAGVTPALAAALRDPEEVVRYRAAREGP
jgi:HEAT repeat protein